MSGLDQLYQALILQHAKEKHGYGLGASSEAVTPPGTVEQESRQYNPLCGDEVTLRVSVADAAGAGLRVADVSWVGEGCSISQASTSTLHDLVVGRSPGEADAIAAAFREMIRSRGEGEPDEEVLGDAVAFQGVGRHANRVKCAMLGWTAFEDALHRAVATSAESTSAESTSAVAISAEAASTEERSHE